MHPNLKQRPCYICGGFGKKDGCPQCGLTLRSAASVRTMQLDMPADIIPIPYQGKLWERPAVEGLPLRFVEFDNALETITAKFMSGLVPSYSAFLAAPPKYGKQAFAYSCMQLAISSQFSVAPLFSTSDWRRLYRVSQMNPFYKLYDKYQWDTLISKDVVFIFVDYSDDRFDVIGLMKDILDARSRFSKATFFLSDFKLDDLVKTWQGDDYNLIYNTDPDRDVMRYPYVVQRFLGGND